MKIRNLLLYILIMLTFLPIVVHAQLDINRLQDGKRGFGFGYRQHPDPLFLSQHNILVTAEYGFSESINGSEQVTITNYGDVYDLLSFSSRSQIMHIDSITAPRSDVGGLEYGYFFLGGFEVAFLYVPEDVSEVYKQFQESDFVALQFFAGVGLYASYGTLKPFILYNFIHERIFDTFSEFTNNSHLLSGDLHLNFSDSISLMGRAIFNDSYVVNPWSFRSSNNPWSFEFGINFGLGKKGKRSIVETPTTVLTENKADPSQVETPTTTVPEKKVEQPLIESPTTPASYRYKKDDTLLIKVKNYLYFAKVTADTDTTAKEIPIKFFIQ